jgi:hypothetical protein
MRGSIAAPEGGGKNQGEIHHLNFARALKGFAKFFVEAV